MNKFIYLLCLIELICLTQASFPFDFIGDITECHFCEDGLVFAKHRKLKPRPNGCGTSLLKLKDVPQDVKRCCNAHDMCYSDCWRTKQQCDEDFKKCTSHASGGANLLHILVEAFGCSAYTSAQEEACKCFK